RYNRDPLGMNTLDELPQDTTGLNMYLATSSGASGRLVGWTVWTPYSVSTPIILVSTRAPRTPADRGDGRPGGSHAVPADRDPTVRVLHGIRWCPTARGSREWSHPALSTTSAEPLGAVAEGLGRCPRAPTVRDVLTACRQK